MTTLFNLFCPFFSTISLPFSVFIMVSMTIMMVLFLMKSVMTSVSSKSLESLSFSLFPLTGAFTSFYFSVFILISSLNLISMVGFSYPVTTTLAFNLSMAFSFWFLSILLFLMKTNFISFLVPNNSPWYLVAFLSLVELVSLLVRPITLCFRLLANMSAGHILLSLISKLPLNTWLLGTLFGGLELMVAVVQSFVFLMLVSVYLEEAISH